MSTDLGSESSEKFHCIICDYYTSRKSQYDRHILTDKHKNQQLSTFVNEKVPESSNTFTCECGKKYRDRSGLWRHTKKCHITNNENNLNNIDITDSNIIVQLIKQNDEFKHLLVEQSKAMVEQNKTIIELSKNISNTNISHSNINSHNKTFNLQFFLNETCKDAMNIMDFVDSIKIQLCDLENVGKLGFVDGISKIIVKNLNSLEENMRPVHCTDTKREVMYVKDDNKWEKENENKQKMRKVIKHVTHKNSKLLKDFKTKYPGCEKSDSKYSDKYDKLIIEAMGGKGDNDLEKEDKIIKNIAKTVVIDKELL